MNVLVITVSIIATGAVFMLIGYEFGSTNGYKQGFNKGYEFGKGRWKE